jgi:XTP/dITP diphosphohydrolase
MMTTIVLVTRNLGKLDEIRKLMPDSYNLVTLSEVGFKDEIEETGATFTENALLKARIAHNKLNMNTLADDSGLETEALNGAPGVFSARYAGNPANDEANVEKLLNELSGFTNRKAQFRSVLALILDGKEFVFEGLVKGSIAHKAQGTNGFGYDPVFVPDGYDKPFAEMPSETKNQISHRAEAVRKMVHFLENPS